MRVTELRNAALGLDKMTAEDGTPYWRVAFVQRDTGDITFVNFDEETIEQFVKKATGGIEIVRSL